MKAYVLAGGKGSRLSARKGLLEVGGRPILERVCEVAVPLVEELALVGPAELLVGLGHRVIPDASEDAGPLAGICAALADAGPDDALVLPWDAPFITTAVLDYLRLAKGTADAVVPRRGDYAEPLFALYGPRCRQPAERALAAGRRRVVAFFEAVQVRWVGPDELGHWGDWDTLFLNVNTPEDLERARRLADLAAGDEA